jgi:hypothetical protein
VRAFDRSAGEVSAATSSALNGSPDLTSNAADMVDGMVGSQHAADGVKASITVLRSADAMVGTLLDMFA